LLIDVIVPGLDDHHQARVLRAVRSCLILITLLGKPHIEIAVNRAVLAKLFSRLSTLSGPLQLKAVAGNGKPSSNLQLPRGAYMPEPMGRQPQKRLLSAYEKMLAARGRA
jgi:hypothetical protein